jgi:hypothetical protein
MCIAFGSGKTASIINIIWYYSANLTIKIKSYPSEIFKDGLEIVEFSLIYISIPLTYM